MLCLCPNTKKFIHLSLHNKQKALVPIIYQLPQLGWTTFHVALDLMITYDYPSKVQLLYMGYIGATNNHQKVIDDSPIGLRKSKFSRNDIKIKNHPFKIHGLDGLLRWEPIKCLKWYESNLHTKSFYTIKQSSRIFPVTLPSL